MHCTQAQCWVTCLVARRLLCIGHKCQGMSKSFANFCSKTSGLALPRWTSRCEETCGKNLKKCRCCSATTPSQANLIPRVLSYQPMECERERPWLGVVMCLQNKTNPQGGIVCFLAFLPHFHCHCQIEAIDITLWSKFSAMFYSSLHVAIIPVTQSNYSNINLRPKQVKCVEAISCGRDVVAILPTGYGKSRIVHVLPSLLHKKIKSCRPAPSPSFCLIIIVVSPLNALIKDQIRRSNDGQVKATFLNGKRRENSGN